MPKILTLNVDVQCSHYWNAVIGWNWYRYSMQSLFKCNKFHCWYGMQTSLNWQYWNAHQPWLKNSLRCWVIKWVKIDVMRSTKEVILRYCMVKKKSSYWQNLLWCFRIARLRGTDAAPWARAKRRNSENRFSLTAVHHPITQQRCVRYWDREDARLSLSFTGTEESSDAARAFLPSGGAFYTRVLCLRCARARLLRIAFLPFVQHVPSASNPIQSNPKVFAPSSRNGHMSDI